MSDYVIAQLGLNKMILSWFDSEPDKGSYVDSEKLCEKVNVSFIILLVLQK